MHAIRSLTLAAAALFLTGTVASEAQVPSDFTVVASGLNAPRGLRFGPGGALYIAEGGTGGTNATTASQCQQVPGPVGPYTGGDTGDIVRIDATGKKSVVAKGFPSTVAATGDLSSVADVLFIGGDLYALIAGGGCSHGNPTAPNGIAKVDAISGKWEMLADLGAYAVAHPGAYPSAGDYEPDGVWFRLIQYGGNLVTVEPNHGLIVSVSPSTGSIKPLIDVSASQGHIVPTAMATYGDQIYVGNLLYFPILQKWSRIMRLAPTGDISQGDVPGYGSAGGMYIAESLAGFTTIVGAAVGPDQLLYVLELSDNPGLPSAGNGKVVRIELSGKITEVITGLTVPGGMTWGPDHRLYISDRSAVPAPNYGAGRVLAFNVAF